MPSAGVATSDIESVVIGKVTRRLFPLMIILTMVNFIDRVNIGYAALTMNKDLGIDPAVFGFAAGIFFLGYVLFEVPSNVLLHRIGANIWLARIMLTWGVVVIGMAFVSGSTGLYVMRFLLGVAEAGFIPGMTLYILLWIPLRHRARLTAVWILATPFAGIVGGPLAGLLLQLDGVLGFKGWQWLFIAEGRAGGAACDRHLFLPHAHAGQGALARRQRAAMAAAHACVGGRENPRRDPAKTLRSARRC